MRALGFLRPISRPPRSCRVVSGRRRASDGQGAIACRPARPSVPVAVSLGAVRAARRGVLLAALSRRCAPGSSAWPIPVSVIAIVRLARRTAIDRRLVLAVVFSRDWSAGQPLDVAQLAYLLPIAQRNGNASSAGACGAADPMHVAFGHVGKLEIHDVC